MNDDGATSTSTDQATGSHGESSHNSDAEGANSGLRSVLATDFDVWQALGGVRGLVETGAPSLIFVAVYVATGELIPSIVAPLIIAVGAIVVRLIQRIDAMPALGGLLGIVISAVWAWRSGEATNYFATGLITNAAYLAGILLSLAVRWPALGFLIGFMRGDPTRWRTDPTQAATKKAYIRITWIWAGLFAFRILVQAPLFFSDATTLLGIARLLMGPLLFALVAWFTWLIVRKLPPVQVDDEPEQAGA
ncbi:MAG: DUF3159 domain-containing protein [Ancrocorticia sp.]